MAKASTKKVETEETGKKVIAVHEIVRCVKPGVNGDPKNNVPGKKPVVQTIKPGTVFMANDTDENEETGETEYSSLKAAEAIRDWSKKDEADVRRMTSVVGNVDDEAAVAESSSTSVKTSANAGTTTAGSTADGTNLI